MMSKLGSNLVQFQAAHRTLLLLAEDPQSGSTRQAGKMVTLADNPGGSALKAIIESESVKRPTCILTPSISG